MLAFRGTERRASPSSRKPGERHPSSSTRGALGLQISRRLLHATRTLFSFFFPPSWKDARRKLPGLLAPGAHARSARGGQAREGIKRRTREGREASGAFLCRRCLCMMYRPGCGRSSMIPSSRPKENSSSGPRCSRSGASTNPTPGSSRGRSPRRSRSPSPRGRRHHRSPSGGRPPRRSPSPRRSSRVRSP